MLLSSVSKRGSKRAAFSPGKLQYKRQFIFLPYSRIVKCRRKGVPEDPIQLLFSRSRRSEDSQQQRRVWGRRWEYEEKDGVAKQTSSEYVPGKGWVKTDLAYPEVKNQENLNSNKMLEEEFDIDFITLRKVPRAKLAEKHSQKLDNSPKTIKLSPSTSCDKLEQPGLGELTAGVNLQQLSAKPLPVDKEYLGASLPSTTQQVPKRTAEKDLKKDHFMASESARAAAELSWALSNAATGRGGQERFLGDFPSKPRLTSTITVAKTAGQEVYSDDVPVNATQGAPKVSLGETLKAYLEASATLNTKEAPALSDSKLVGKTKAISLTDNDTSKPGGHGTLHEILQDQKHALGKMAPPPLPEKQAKPDEAVVANILDTLGGAVGGFQKVLEAESLSARRIGSGSAAPSGASMDVAKRLPSLPLKPAEQLNMGVGKSGKSGAASAVKPLEGVPSSVITSGEVSGWGADSVTPGGTVSAAEDVSRPTPPLPVATPDKSKSAIVNGLASDSTWKSEKRIVSPSPASAKCGTHWNDVDPASIVISQPMPLGPAAPVLHSKPSVIAKTQAVDVARGLGPSSAKVDAFVPSTDSAVSPGSSSGAGAKIPVSSFFASDPMTEISEKAGGVTAPLSSRSLADEPLKYHRLNIANRPREVLDSADADIDILLPSDIRAAAGAPGKTVTRIESAAEKQQRRAKMVEEFEASYEREKPGAFESQKALRERILQTFRMEQTSTAGAVEDLHRMAAIEGGLSADAVSRTQTPKSCENLSKERGVRPPEESEDYVWSGTEDVSAEDVLGIGGLHANPLKNLVSTSNSPATQQTDDSTIQALPATPLVTYRFFALVRNPENGNIQFTTLPQRLVSDTMIRENTAFDSLQNLDSPESFLPLWRVLQKGGFTVVGGEKDCLVVKVEAEVAREKQELVLKEIKVRLSPAETAARESWERKRGVNKSGAEKEFDTASSVGRVANVATAVKLDPGLATAPEKVPPIILDAPLESKPESAAIDQKIEEVAAEDQKPTEHKAGVQANQLGKSRPFRRVFWSAVWVAACTGAVSIGLEAYL